jgi:hypothetical protein
MKIAFIALTIFGCALLVNGQFSKTLANLDVDAILKNDRILTNYVKCILDKGDEFNESERIASKNTFKLKVHAHRKVAS